MCNSTDVEYLLGAVQNVESELETQFGDDGITRKALRTLDDANVLDRIERLERAVKELAGDPGNPFLAADMARHELNREG